MCTSAFNSTIVQRSSIKCNCRIQVESAPSGWKWRNGGGVHASQLILSLHICQASNENPAKPLWTLCRSTAVTLTYLTDRTKWNVFYIVHPPPHPWVTYRSDLSLLFEGDIFFFSVIKRDNVPIPSYLLPIYPVSYLSLPQHLLFKPIRKPSGKENRTVLFFF